jgi:class 3 adenylate cyclase
MGLTFGMDHGDVIRLVMNGKPEYIGRALNIASRLQGKVKEIAPRAQGTRLSCLGAFRDRLLGHWRHTLRRRSQ